MTSAATDIPAAVASELLPGETVLWQGRSGGVSLKKDTGGAVILTWLIYTAIFVIVSAAFIWAEIAAGYSVNLLWQAMLTIIWLFFMVRPIQDRAKILSSRYYITDRRVILALGGKDFCSLIRSGLRARKTVSASGRCDILIGSAVSVPDKKHFKYAWDPCRGDYNEGVTGFVFFNLPDDPELDALLSL